MSDLSSLKQTTLFSQLSDAALTELGSMLQARPMRAGEVLFNLGDPGDELFIVQTGTVAIYAPVSGQADQGQAIRRFTAGQTLGEMALIDRQPRSLSARAEEDSLVLALRGSDFRRLLAQNPDTAQAVMAGLSERIRYTTSFLEEVRGWVRRMADGSFQAAQSEQAQYTDPALAVLAQEFARMATVVQEREDLLRREVMQLRIEIDQAKRKEDAQQIIGSDYYQVLKARAREMRADVTSEDKND
jgi:CRP-like cAMP-binding protein